MEVTAIATRTGKWWAIEVPQIPGLYTQVKHLDQVEDMVRDAASAMGRDVDAITVAPRLAADDEALLHELNSARAAAAASQEQASSLTRTAIGKFRAQGLTLRDVSAIIGLTPQRVSAIAATMR